MMDNITFYYTIQTIKGNMTTDTDKVTDTVKLVPYLYRKTVNENVSSYFLNNSETFLKAKQVLETKLKELFAYKRDSVRWVGGYGYDCDTASITNFLAAYIKLNNERNLWINKGGIGEEPYIEYKVYVNKDTLDKDIVKLTMADLNVVYDYVRKSQFESYEWLKNELNNLSKSTTISDIIDIAKRNNITFDDIIKF